MQFFSGAQLQTTLFHIEPLDQDGRYKDGWIWILNRVPSLFMPGYGRRRLVTQAMMTSSNGNIFRVTGHLSGEFTGYRWIPRTNASDAEFWCFLWSAHEYTVEYTFARLMIWDAIAPIDWLIVQFYYVTFWHSKAKTNTLIKYHIQVYDLKYAIKKHQHNGKNNDKHHSKNHTIFNRKMIQSYNVHAIRH